MTTTDEQSACFSARKQLFDRPEFRKEETEKYEKGFFVRYALLLKPHANVRYRQSLQKLAKIELECMLSAWGMENVTVETAELAGEPFLTFETNQMTQEAWREISRHSSICLAAQQLEGSMLLPIQRAEPGFLPDELPHVLKYKGKTNADFTYLMLHCAKAASAFAREEGPLQVLDPMCGKATTLFCAACEGHHASGVDMDGKALSEAEIYYERFLKLHRIKHKRTEGSRTLKKGGNARFVAYDAAQDAQSLKQKPLKLELMQCDASRLSELVKPNSFHLVVSDLPYGVQHAPKEKDGLSTLARLLKRSAAGCLHALKPGGAAAFSFNLNTLPRKEAAYVLAQAGFDHQK